MKDRTTFIHLCEKWVTPLSRNTTSRILYFTVDDDDGERLRGVSIATGTAGYTSHKSGVNPTHLNTKGGIKIKDLLGLWIIAAFNLWNILYCKPLKYPQLKGKLSKLCRLLVMNKTNKYTKQPAPEEHTFQGRWWRMSVTLGVAKLGPSLYQTSGRA